MSAHKKRNKRLLVFGLLLLCLSYLGFAYTEPLAAISPKEAQLSSLPAKPVNLAWPGYGESAVGAVGYGVLASHGDTPLPTASLAKVFTALVVLKQRPLTLGQNGPTLTLTQADVDWFNHYYVEDGSVINVAVGEQLSEFQALEAMLLPSANNIADTLAVWSSGSVEAFNNTANALAHQLGMNATTITDPSGFLPTTVSSPRDLTILGEAALANPVIAHIVSLPSVTIPVQGVVNNVNFLLNQKGIVGIKTGNNDQDHGCFLFAANRAVAGHQLTIVGTIIGGPALISAMTDSLPLIESTAAGFGNHLITPAGTLVASYSVPWQGKVSAVTDRNLYAFSWNGAPTQTSLIMQNITGLLDTGTQIGTLTAKNDSSPNSNSVPVVISQKVSAPSFRWRLFHTV